jgi:hypothetical protein
MARRYSSQNRHCPENRPAMGANRIGQEDLVATKRKRKYSRGASRDVEREMRRYKRGTLRSGRGGRGGKVKSRRQAIAIGLSEARKEGKRVPRKR